MVSFLFQGFFLVFKVLFLFWVVLFFRVFDLLIWGLFGFWFLLFYLCLGLWIVICMGFYPFSSNNNHGLLIKKMIIVPDSEVMVGYFS